MKKTILIFGLFLCSLVTQAQVGLTMSSPIKTSDVSALPNAYCEAVFHVQDMLNTGVVQCDLKFYVSYAAKLQGADNIYPIVGGHQVLNCTINVGVNDVIKDGGTSTMSDVVTLFYGKVKNQLLTQYNLTAN